jgi:hypothetical protein
VSCDGKKEIGKKVECNSDAVDSGLLFSSPDSLAHTHKKVRKAIMKCKKSKKMKMMCEDEERK